MEIIEEPKEVVPVVEEPPIPGFEFLSQIDFSKSGKIKGYSTKIVTFTFIPIALGEHQVQLLIKFDKEQYSPSFAIDLR